MRLHKVLTALFITAALWVMGGFPNPHPSFAASTEAPLGNHGPYRAGEGAFTGSKSGYAFYYSPGVMEKVARVRAMQMIPTFYTNTPAPIGTPRVDGYASTTDCSKIGHLAYARIGNGPVEVYQILDCSAPKDVRRHMAVGNVIEVDYESSVRHGFFGIGKKAATLYHITESPDGFMGRAEWSCLQRAIYGKEPGFFEYMYQYPLYVARYKLGNYR